MAKTKKKSKGNEENSAEDLLTEYRKIKLPVSTEPINTSQFTLPQQLKRFEEFSHTENEFMILTKEANKI